MVRFFKKVYGWITGFTADKYMHFIAGAAIVGFLSAVGSLFPVDSGMFTVLCPGSFFWGIVASFLKEIYDIEVRKGKFDEVSMAFTCAGAFLQWIAVIVLMKFY